MSYITTVYQAIARTIAYDSNRLELWYRGVPKLAKLNFWTLRKPALDTVYKQATIPVLGRWNIEKCSTKLDIKIKLANEDNCGSCSNYTPFVQKNISCDVPKMMN